MLATWIVPTEANVAARTMNPFPVTPAAPFEVRRKAEILSRRFRNAHHHGFCRQQLAVA